MSFRKVFHSTLAALILSALPGSLACMDPVGPDGLGKCGPRPSQEQADACTRSFCPRALKLPFDAVVQNVSIVGPEKIYTRLLLWLGHHLPGPGKDQPRRLHGFSYGNRHRLPGREDPLATGIRARIGLGTVPPASFNMNFQPTRSP